jgi:hypothetical protein
MGRPPAPAFRIKTFPIKTSRIKTFPIKTSRIKTFPTEISQAETFELPGSLPRIIASDHWRWVEIEGQAVFFIRPAATLSGALTATLAGTLSVYSLRQSHRGS